MLCPSSSSETSRSASSTGTPSRVHANLSVFLLRESNALLMSHDERKRGVSSMEDCSNIACSCSNAVSVPRLGRKPCCDVCSILCCAHVLLIFCMIRPIHIFLSTSTSTSGRSVSGVMCSGFLGFRHSVFHFHHSGMSFVPQDGIMLS